MREEIWLESAVCLGSAGAYRPRRFSQSQSTDIADFISSAYSNRAFATTPVEPKDLELILRCGVRAPQCKE